MKQAICLAAILGILGSTAAAAPAARPVPTGQGPIAAGPGSVAASADATMAKVLELTAAQQPRWTAEAERSRGVLAPLWEAMATQSSELRSLMERKGADGKTTAAADGEIKPALDALNATRAAIRKEQDLHETNALAILTPAQGAKYTMLFAERVRMGWGRPMPRPMQRPPVR